LASKLEVKATYTAINDPSKQETKDLTYWYAVENWTQEGQFGTTPTWGGTFNSSYFGPYYWFSSPDVSGDPDLVDEYYREPDDATDADSTYSKGFDKWLNAKGGKDVTTKLTIVHRILTADVAAFYQFKFADDYNTAYGGGGSTIYNSPILPDGYHWFNAAAESGTPAWINGNQRPFGPKDEQQKKAKVSVTWTHK